MDRSARLTALDASPTAPVGATLDPTQQPLFPEAPRHSRRRHRRSCSTSTRPKTWWCRTWDTPAGRASESPTRAVVPHTGRGISSSSTTSTPLSPRKTRRRQHGSSRVCSSGSKSTLPWIRRQGPRPFAVFGCQVSFGLGCIGMTPRGRCRRPLATPGARRRSEGARGARGPANAAAR